MKLLGIIAEYNPFHNGHLYQLQQSVDQYKPDATIAVMSGNFIQRGDVALFDKFTRAKIAVENGIDLVIELPAYYAVSTAETFASAGVKLLTECGITALSFGCEENNFETLEKIAETLANESEIFKNILKKHLDNGLSFPQARSKTLQELLPDQDLTATLNAPNNILAIEYLKALKRQNYACEILPIQRKNTGYHDLNGQENIASATAIREMIRHKKDVTPYLSQQTLAMNLTNKPLFLQNFQDLILYALRKMTLEQLKEIPDITEGLENRIHSALKETTTLSELIEKIKTKRYPETRIKRILIAALLGFTKTAFSSFQQAGGPQYIRVLACNETGKKALSEIATNSKLPIITSLKRFLTNANELQKNMLFTDISATDIYTLLSEQPMNLDFKNIL